MYDKKDYKFEYFQLGWPVLKPWLSKFLEHAGPTLEIGCGSSPLCDDMIISGFTNIVCIDYASTVIDKRNLEQQQQQQQQQQQKEAESEAGESSTPMKLQVAEFLCMDATAMSFEDSKFASVFEKGLLDTLDTREDGDDAARLVVREAARVLRQGGHFVVVTCRSAERRMECFDDKENELFELIETGRLSAEGPSSPASQNVIVLKRTSATYLQ